MDTAKRPVPIPEVEIAKQRAAGRQVFRHSPPLATRRKNVHEAVHYFAQNHCALATTPLTSRDQRFNVSALFYAR
jgi:hypothetical protein